MHGGHGRVAKARVLASSLQSGLLACSSTLRLPLLSTCYMILATLARSALT